MDSSSGRYGKLLGYWIPPCNPCNPCNLCNLCNLRNLFSPFPPSYPFTAHSGNISLPYTSFNTWARPQ